MTAQIWAACSDLPRNPKKPIVSSDCKIKRCDLSLREREIIDDSSVLEHRGHAVFFRGELGKTTTLYSLLAHLTCLKSQAANLVLIFSGTSIGGTAGRSLRTMAYPGAILYTHQLEPKIQLLGLVGLLACSLA
jgi:hypothetical protein